MAKFPYLTQRKGSRNLYYKRDVEPALWAEGRPQQIWRSLKTSDRKRAKKAYAALHAEIESLLDGWRIEDRRPTMRPSSTIPQAPPAELPIVPLTASLLKRLSDTYYQETFEADFKLRGELWGAVEKDQEAFWRGEIIEHPKDYVQVLRGQEFNYYDYLIAEPELEPIFLYCLHVRRKRRVEGLQRQYALGIITDQEASSQSLLQAQGLRLTQDDIIKLGRQLLRTETKAIEDIIARDDSAYDAIIAKLAVANEAIPSATAKSSGELMSALVEKYIADASRERNWPKKTFLRKKSELREFVELCGDKPAHQYVQADGVAFKDAQSVLPANRQRSAFKGLGIREVVMKARDLQIEGTQFDLLSTATIRDKLNTVSGFFEWIKGRDATALNPVATLKIKSRRRSSDERREPFTVDELNRIFRAPIYTGCLSRPHWSKPGQLVLDSSAIYWIPLVGLFSGLRLGEIIQLETNDIKIQDRILHFDITISSSISDGRESEKSLKTTSSRRKIPIHKSLLALGFEKYVEERRTSGDQRLFVEFARSADDDSWSKRFSKHFLRFRRSIGITRDTATFHSFRHNFEDALRNANIPKDVRDAIQGHGENGVSREYGTGFYIQTLNKALQKTKYTGLNISHLASFAGPARPLPTQQQTAVDGCRA